jgi:hypothetical protein
MVTAHRIVIPPALATALPARGHVTPPHPASPGKEIVRFRRVGCIVLVSHSGKIRALE